MVVQKVEDLEDEAPSFLAVGPSFLEEGPSSLGVDLQVDPETWEGQGVLCHQMVVDLCKIKTQWHELRNSNIWNINHLKIN